MGGHEVSSNPPHHSWLELMGETFPCKVGWQGRDFIQYAQMNPFRAIFQICAPLPDEGPKYIPNIKDASLLRKVCIGAVVPSGNGTLKCNGVILPVSRVMGAIDSSSALTVLNFEQPG